MKNLYFVYGSYIKYNEPETLKNELCYICYSREEAESNGLQLLSFDEICGIKYVSFDIIQK